ncbi:MAG: DUF2520 domain-containing protein [Paludibacteraceae bacterium]|nr:DUF2520 domain-containing protein [Paludibacteraceae bacterium]MBP6284916.1 DUF2520 domain-containing protein [Paludibacteraceae bacterium]
MQELVVIGAGNVATHLAIALQKKGVHIRQVVSRTEASAQALAKTLSTSYTCKKNEVYTDADIYICCVKDSEIATALAGIPLQNKVVLHTAGSVSIDVLRPFSSNFGVLYPLQTFSKSKTVDWQNIPLYIEGNSTETTEKIHTLATLLSNKVQVVNSDKRKDIHIAAVFSCNFVNHLYTLSAELLDKAGVDFKELLPLIQETSEKLDTLTPFEAQTGPAMRNDTLIMEEHMAQLAKKDHNKAAIYALVSKSIFTTHHQ